MCDYKLIRYERPLKTTKRILLISRQLFNKFFNDKYLRVLVSSDRQGLSKSYYYYILDFLKDIGLIEDNAITMSTIIPFVTENDKIILDKAVLSVMKDGIVLIDLNSSKFNCSSCPLKAECKYGIKNVARSLRIKPKGKTLNEMWGNLISEVSKRIVNNVMSIKV